MIFHTYYYWVFILLGIFSCSIFYIKFYKKKFTNLDFGYSVLVDILLLGLLASYFFPIVELYLLKIPIPKNPLDSGERWYASLFFVTNYLAIKYSKKQNFKELFNVICIIVCLGISIGKLGCFFSGHYGCYGIPTNLPWAVLFKNETHSSLVKVHPVQLYDSIFHFILFIILYLKKYKNTAIIFLISTSGYNILIEIIRTNNSIFLNLSLAQIIYIILLFEIFIYTIIKRKKLIT